MDKQFNGLLQRSSIMSTWWLLRACIVLAVGVGLVSCTNVQKDQGMTQPAAVSQSPSPCQPGRIVLHRSAGVLCECDRDTAVQS